MFKSILKSTVILCLALLTACDNNSSPKNADTAAIQPAENSQTQAQGLQQTDASTTDDAMDSADATLPHDLYRVSKNRQDGGCYRLEKMSNWTTKNRCQVEIDRNQDADIEQTYANTNGEMGLKIEDFLTGDADADAELADIDFDAPGFIPWILNLEIQLFGADVVNEFIHILDDRFTGRAPRPFFEYSCVSDVAAYIEAEALNDKTFCSEI